jgi:hypothetical protein
MTTYERIATSPRKIAMTAGIFYLLTFVSIPTLSLYSSIHDPNYVIGPGPDTNAFIGVILELIVALTGIGSAVALYPLLKKQNGGVALGLVGSRVLEAGTIFAGAAFLLSVVSLRQSSVGVDALVTGQALVTLYDRIFSIGQGLIPAVDDLLLGYLLYKSRLVPRTLSIIGLVGVPILVIGFISVLLGLIGRFDPLAVLTAVPVALFEFSLGIWLVVKGFDTTTPLLMATETNN